MRGSDFIAAARRAGALAGAALVAGTLAAASASAAEITVRIDRIRALDRVDWGLAGQADFYARVSIAGKETTTKVIKNKDDVRPGWVIRERRLKPGVHDVRIQIFDRDPLKADTTVDINRIDKKRDIEFKIDTRRCRIDGFSTQEKCGRTINRAGQERKKAEIWFRASAR